MRNAKLGKKASLKTKEKMSLSQIGRKAVNKLTVKIIKEKYPFFYKIEQPIQKDNKILVRCKNCNKIFVPDHNALKNRIWALEKDDGNDGVYLYCSTKCKNECPLFGLNPVCYIDKTNLETIYTENELGIWRTEVFKRANYLCEYCGKPAEHAHHIKPKKLEPFFALDPDYGVACCAKCHYKYGHKNECKTTKIASKNCTEVGG